MAFKVTGPKTSEGSTYTGRVTPAQVKKAAAQIGPANDAAPKGTRTAGSRGAAEGNPDEYFLRPSSQRKTGMSNQAKKPKC